MTRHVLRFRSALNEAAGGRASYIFHEAPTLWGSNYPHEGHDSPEDEEIGEPRPTTEFTLAERNRSEEAGRPGETPGTPFSGLPPQRGAAPAP